MEARREREDAETETWQLIRCQNEKPLSSVLFMTVTQLLHSGRERGQGCKDDGRSVPRAQVSGSVWREDSYVLSLLSPSSLFKRNSTLLPGTEVIVWGRLGSPLVNILFTIRLLSLTPLSWDMDCLLTLWLLSPLVPLVTVAVHLVFWSLSFPKEVSCTAAYNLIGKSLKHLCFIRA